jgi:hypothetical protein
VPKVQLHATHEKALGSVSLNDLNAYAAAPEAGFANGTHGSSESRHGGRVTATELANKDGMVSGEL